jgi:hypothetical protein
LAHKPFALASAGPRRAIVFEEARLFSLARQQRGRTRQAVTQEIYSPIPSLALAEGERRRTQEQHARTVRQERLAAQFEVK